MLKAEDNEILTRVGPGTLMGELLRRYWTPACLTAEIPEPGSPPARVRLLGENLVAFRDTRGRVGLVQENCPHRGASLYFGRNEERGAPLRLPRVGVRRGRHVRGHAQRAGPFCEKVRMKAYPTHESGGIVWTYMGPRETMTPFRDFGTDGLTDGEAIATQAALDLQLGAGDGRQHRHLAHLPPAPVGRHRRPPRRRLGQARLPVQRDVVEVLAARPRAPARGRRHLVRLPLRGHPHHAERQTHVRVTAYALPYATMVASIPFSVGCGMFVPIDDENCWRYFSAPKAWRNPRNYGGENLFSLAPFSTPVTNPRNGITPRLYTAENDYQLSAEVREKGASSAASTTS